TPLNLQTEATVTTTPGAFHFALTSPLAREFYRFTVRDVFVPPGPALPAVDLTDTDGDQIPDATELNLASMGFAVGADSSALRQQLLTQASGLGLLPRSSVRGIAFQGPGLFTKTAGNTVTFDLNLSLETPAGTWIPATFQPADITITGPDLQLILPSDSTVEYYRLAPTP
ncbi:MAG: hypothetical protein RIQ79_55, partial [Verrucomicrobiota bacterium]